MLAPIPAPPAMHMHVHRCTLAQCRGREFTIEDCVTPVVPTTPLHRPWHWASSCYTRAQTRMFRHPCTETRCRRAASLDSVPSCHFPASCGYHPALCAIFAAAPPSTRMMVCAAEPRDCWPHETCSVRNGQRDCRLTSEFRECFLASPHRGRHARRVHDPCRGIARPVLAAVPPRAPLHQ